MLLGHVLDQLCLLGRVRAREVDQLHIVLLGRRFGPFTDNVPECVARLGMGDHRDGDLLVLCVSRTCSERHRASKRHTDGMRSPFALPILHLVLPLFTPLRRGRNNYCMFLYLAKFHAIRRESTLMGSWLSISATKCSYRRKGIQAPFAS